MRRSPYSFVLLYTIAWFPFLGLPCALAIPHGSQADPTYLEELLAQAAKAKLADSRYWHLLIHYQRNLFGSGYRSQVDDPAFFLAPQGKTDPQAELAATLHAFFATTKHGDAELSAQCTYVARYRWLKTTLAIDESRLPLPSCPEFDAWYDSLSPKTLTLVFPAAYMNNPASMFGHTLLRIDQQGQTEQTRLLAYSINFGAKDTSTNWLSYALSGIGGWFQGHFFIKPYYLLVKEYGDFENRDMWEYRLQLTEEQVKRLLMHVWELRERYFDYFFFTENCSYQLLPLLEVADPDLHLTDRFWVWTIPADTIRLLMAQPGLMTDITYRPSPSTQIRRTYSLLSPTERHAVNALLFTPSTVEAREWRDLLPPQRAPSLELAIAYLQYQRAKEEKRKIVSTQDRLHHLLTMRSQLDALSPEISTSPFVSQPDAGHHSFRTGVGLGWRQRDSFEEVTVRAGYHDLLDPTPGYTPDAQIEILTLSIRHYHRRHRVRVDRLTFVDAISLSPVEPLFFAPSWKGKMQLSTLDRKRCGYCQNFTLNGGLGLAAQTSWLQREVYFVFPEVDVNVSQGFTPHYRGGAGGTAGILVDLSGRWKALLLGTYLRYPLGDRGEVFRGIVAHEYTFHKHWAVRCQFRYERHDSETMLLLYAYF